jgi:hypothetical protein
VNRHERRKSEAVARYRYGTKHGSPKPSLEAQEKTDRDKAQNRKRLLMTKQEKTKR